MAKGSRFLTSDQALSIQERARANGFSQAEVAARAGLDPSNLSKVLRGKQAMTTATELRLNQALQRDSEAEVPEAMPLRLVGWQDACGWGWTLEHLLTKVVRLDGELHGRSETAAKTRAEDWLPLFSKNPAALRVIFTADGEIQGCWAMLPLDLATYRLLLDGRLAEDQIRPDDVCSLALPGEYVGFCPILVVRPEWRELGIGLLLNSLADQLESHARGGVFFRELAFNAATEDEVWLCKELELLCPEDRRGRSAIYRAELLRYPQSSFLTRFPRLQLHYLERVRELAGVEKHPAQNAREGTL